MIFFAFPNDIYFFPPPPTSGGVNTITSLIIAASDMKQQLVNHSSIINVAMVISWTIQTLKKGFWKIYCSEERFFWWKYSEILMLKHGILFLDLIQSSTPLECQQNLKQLT